MADNKMRTIYVGDLHGKLEVAQTILKNKHDKIVFVGDYLDSFDRTISDQISTLKMVLEATKAEPERVIALRGNHEWSYLYPQFYACSGFNQNTLARTKPLRESMLTDLKDSYFDEDARVLVTHAGISQSWLDYIDMDLDVALLKASDRQWNMVGRARGGTEAPGPVWCDYWQEFEPVPWLSQVFGHTQYRHVGKDRGVVSLNQCFNIDCLDTSDEVLVWSPKIGMYTVPYRDL